MGDLEPSELSLNLTSAPPEPKKRREREEGEGEGEGEQDEGRHVQKKRRRNDGGSKDSSSGPSSNNETYISSLFNHNPEIPHMSLSAVEPLREEIFTSQSFSDVGIHPYLVKNMVDFNIKEMTQVQMKSIPFVLAGKDALIKSQTGSGKTLAYAIPILQKLQEIRPEIQRTSGIFAVIVVPTRELAIQSFEWFDKLCRSFARIVPGMLVGGEKKKSEKARVRKGINILISTPGRLIDHIQHTECLSLKKLKFLVLDEADRMLELGYERDVQTILTAINEASDASCPRQTLLLSATLTSGIEELSKVSMKHPKFIDAAVGEENAEESLKTLTTPENLKQTFIIAPAKLRLVTLASFILWKCRFSKSRKVLIFMSTQDMVDYHAELLGRCLNDHTKPPKKKSKFSKLHLTSDAREVLEQDGFDEGIENEEEDQDEEDEFDDIEFLKLHGSMTQKDRMEVFKTFRNSSSGVLLCTDVAARGLDLPQVDWIVQYNPPISKADYIHRVGRTARIGTKGSSLLFLLPSESTFVKELEEESLLLAEMTIEQVLQKLFKNAIPSTKTGQMPHNLEESATNLQMKLELAVSNDEGLHSQASQAYVSYVRSYASYPKEIRHVFCFKDLHLGHIAKSYALRDPPSKITGIGKGNWVKNDQRKQQKNLKDEEKVIKAQKKRINQKQLVMSEYASGFDGIDLNAVKKQDKVKKPKYKKNRTKAA